MKRIEEIECESGADDDEPTSSEVYARPKQCQPFQGAIGAHKLRILRDNHAELKFIVIAELKKIGNGRLAKMNFKENEDDKEWQDHVWKLTMEQTNDGKFRGANGRMYRWPRGEQLISTKLVTCQGIIQE
jgi:hypothetical protein